MKIAFIVSAFPVLSETFILNQITGLIDLGHEVDIFVSGKPNEKKIHSDVMSCSPRGARHGLGRHPKTHELYCF